jgi:ADP-heptose:LPS heptosyltransferase
MKPSLVVAGMYGIGDCIHERAPIRELMKQYDVTLEGFYPSLAMDLVEQGLKFNMLTGLRPRIRDGARATTSSRATVSDRRLKLTYNPAEILKAGSILAAQFASCGLKMPERPDFSFPVRDEWRNKAKAMIASWKPSKPVLIYRPIVLNKVWECKSRSPDHVAYADIFAEIANKFFVVSVADLTQHEWIVGSEQDADVKLHRGEVDFETLAGLFAESSLVFANPGFSPVLAQAVGAPCIIVYGGNESFRTTNSVGAHLSPTLAIEPINPCECHARTHDCDKRIDVEAAKAKVMEFACRFAS